MAAHAHLKNEFTEDDKCHNLMRCLNYKSNHIHDFMANHEETADTNRRKEEVKKPEIGQFLQ